MMAVMPKDFFDFDIPDDFEPDNLYWSGSKGMVSFKKKKKRSF